MTDQKVTHMVSGTTTLATGNLTQAQNAPRGVLGVELYGTGASTPTFQFCPLLMGALYFDNSAGTYTDARAELTSRVAADVLTLNSMEAAVDFVYFGCDVPFRGIYLNVGNTNGTASVLAATYWDGAAWTGLTETDGTASAGATLAIDNILTWTVPTDWAKTSVQSNNLYWVRFAVSVTLDASVTLVEAIPLSIQTNKAASPAATVPWPRYWFDRGVVGGIESTGDNADTLVCNWICSRRDSVYTAE